MAAIQYRLSAKNINGKAEVLVRFWSGTTFSQRAKSRIFVPIESWNNSSGCLIIPKKFSPEVADLRELQRKLDALQDAIFTLFIREQYDAGVNWLQDTIDDFFKIPKALQRHKMADIVREYAGEKSLEIGSAAQYETLANILDRYAEDRMVLYSDNLTPENVAKFVKYYKTMPSISKKGKKTKTTRGMNTIIGKLKKLAAACRWAIRKGYMDDTPFGKEDDGKFQIPSEKYGSVIYLTKEERDHLLAFSGLTEHEKVVRDIFVFQCHVGCRISDLWALRQENVANNTLQYVQKKTKGVDPKTITVPLSDIALELIGRYAGMAGGRLFPFPNQVEYVNTIHIVCRKAGLTRNVIVLNPKTRTPETKQLWEVCASHMARKTFTMQIFRQTKSEMVTSSFTGHAPNSKAFSRYAEVEDDMKRDIIDKAEGK